MRYLTSLLVGLGIYLLAVAVCDVFGRMFITRTYLHIHHFSVMLSTIIGHLIGIAAFVAGFYWMFRRTSARNSN
jgi:uncharacterized membrane protein